MGYWKAVAKIWRRNVFLLIITFGLLIVTSGYWLGIPVYVIGDWLYQLKLPDQLDIFVVAFFICVFISLYFLPFHLEVAREMGGNLWWQLWRIEWRFIALFYFSCIGFILVIYVRRMF